jgi:regulator of sigma E protease
LVSPGGAADAAGIKVGDRIVAFNGIENPTWERIKDETLISPDATLPLVVDRGGKQLALNVKPQRKDVEGNIIGEIGLVPDAGVEPVEAGSVVPDSPASVAGLRPGDRVLAFNGQTVRNSQELMNQIRENKDAPIVLTVERAGERKEINAQAKLNDDGIYRIGSTFGSGEILTRERVGPATALAYSWDTNLRIIRLTGRVFGQMFAGERSVKDAGLAGPVGIVQIISKVVTEAGFAGLIMILGVISLNLGVFNLLPIPLLDGGQILVLGIEKVLSWFGRTLNMVWRERIQLAGLAVILLLMVFTLFLDISRFF